MGQRTWETMGLGTTDVETADLGTTGLGYCLLSLPGYLATKLVGFFCLFFWSATDKKEHTQTMEETLDLSCTAHLFQPEAEVKEGVAGVCERCVRCNYPQVSAVQQHVQMSVCVHPNPDTTAHSDVLQCQGHGRRSLKNT